VIAALFPVFVSFYTFVDESAHWNIRVVLRELEAGILSGEAAVKTVS
jgi:hypothetical protein